MSSERRLEGRVRIADHTTYEQARRTVDHLSDRGFPVERIDIIGYDLRTVERISGRLTLGRAAAAGAGTGAACGSLLGLLLVVVGTATETLVVSLLWAVLLSALVGAVVAGLAFAPTRGRRDFTSTSGIVPGRYEVVADAAVADRARELLARAR